MSHNTMITNKIPDWMNSSSSYTPSSDKEGFINHTMKSLLSTLSKIRRNTSIGDEAFGEIKIIYTFVSIILMSISKNPAFTYFIAGISVVHLALLDSNSVKAIIKAGLTACAFSLLFLLPSIFIGNYNNILWISLKILTSVILLSTLTHTTKWNILTKSLRNFHFPPILIFLLDITLKYIYILGDICMGLLNSLKLRSVGINKSKEQSTASILGITYINSKELALETYNAMVCRGFDGEYSQINFSFKEKNTSKIIFFNILYLLITSIIIYMFIIPLH